MQISASGRLRQRFASATEITRSSFPHRTSVGTLLSSEMRRSIDIPRCSPPGRMALRSSQRRGWFPQMTAR